MVAISASRPCSVFLCAAVATALLCVVSGGGSSYKNYFADGEDIDFYVWADVHENPFYDNGVMFSGEPVYRSETKFSWSGTIDAKGVNITLPYSVRSNTSAMFAHIFVTKKGVDPNLYSQQGQVTHEHTLSVLFRTVKLTRLLPEIPIVKKRFLLKEPFLPVEKPLPESERPIVPYWAPRLAVHLVYDTNTYETPSHPSRLSHPPRPSLATRPQPFPKILSPPLNLLFLPADLLKGSNPSCPQQAGDCPLNPQP